MRIAAFATLSLLGCGRLNFNETVVDASSPSTDAALDAPGVAVCGNGTCEGERGELCGKCMSDCAVATAVCGNGQCDAGETCYADCGPANWPWTQDEMDLFAAVNAARTGGVTCPGDSMPRTAPAFTLNASVVPGAREHAWEMAHHEIPAGTGTSCNGRTFPQRQVPYGGSGGLSVSSTGPIATMSQVVDVWKTSGPLCPILMSTSQTMAGAGVAHDAAHGFVIWFK